MSKAWPTHSSKKPDRLTKGDKRDAPKSKR